MAALTPEILFPNAWMRKRRAHVLTQIDEHRVRISTSSGGAAKTVFEGSIEDAAAHVPNSAWLVSALPLQKSVSRTLVAPVKSLRTAASLVTGMLDTEVPFAVDQASHGFPEMVREDGTVRALAIAARNRDIESHVTDLQAHGLDPQLLDHEGLALWTQTLREFGAKNDGKARVLAHCATHRTVLVFGRGRRFLNAQVVNLAADHEEFPTRLERTLRSQFAADEAIDWRRSGMLTASKEAGDKLPRSARTHKKPDQFLARALAHRALKPGPLRFNFRTDHPGLVRARSSRNRMSAIHFLIPGLLLWGLALGWQHFLKQRDVAVQKELSATANAIAGFKVPKGQELLEAERALAGNRSAGRSAFDKMLHPAADEQLRSALGFARRNNMHIETLKFAGDKLVITGNNVLPLERKLGDLREYLPEVEENNGIFKLTLNMPGAQENEGGTP